MARYALDRYGNSTYGGLGLIDYDASPFTAVSRMHGGLSLRWTNPTGAWDRLRLVRSSYGNPVDVNDGATVLEALPGAPASFTDSGLAEGSWYYYSIFVEVTLGLATNWRRAGDTAALVARNHGYNGVLLDRLPSVFTTAKREVGGYADRTGSTQLERFLGIFGFETDYLRTLLESLLDTKDVDRVPGQLLPLLAQQIGVEYEPELGQRQNRVLLRNAVYLHKIKGTTPSITGLASSMTGWAAEAEQGHNLLLTLDDSSAERTSGRWAVVSGSAVVSRRPSDALANPAVIPPGALVGYRTPGDTVVSRGMYRLVTTSAGRVEVELPGGQAGVPVTPAVTYTLSARFRDNGTSRSPRLLLRWYDRLGVYLSATAEEAGSNTTTSDWTGFVDLTATSPAGAYFAQPVMIWPTLAAGETQFADAVQLEEGSTATTYAHPRDLVITLDPDRRNLVSNPSFEVDAAGWTGVNGNVSRTQTVAATSGEWVGRIVPTAADPAAQTTVPTTVGTLYTASLYVEGPAGDYQLVFAGVPGPVVTLAVSTRQRLSVQAVADATNEVLELRSPDGGTAYFDAVLVEEGISLGDYFDGDSASGDSGWVGADHGSISVLYRQRPIRDFRLRDRLTETAPLDSTFTLVYEDGYKASVIDSYEEPEEGYGEGAYGAGPYGD